MTTLTALAALADTNRRNADTLDHVANQLGLAPQTLADRESVTVYWSSETVGPITVVVESSYRLEDGTMEHGISVDGAIDGEFMDVAEAGKYVTAFTEAQNLLQQVTDAITASGRVNLLKSA